MTRWVAITGAANGIGKELAKQYIQNGYNVIGVDIDEVELKKIAKQLGQNFVAIFSDFSRKENVLRVCEQIISEYGTPAIWFNNAAILQRSSFLNIDADDFDRTIDLNLKAVVYATRFWLQQMQQRGLGTIVNMGSVAGHLSTPGMLAYSTSKFALVGFTESLQTELEIQKSKVKLILVCPGFVQTTMMAVGEANGFPPELAFMGTTVEACVERIIQGVKKEEKYIAPTANGNALLLMQRVSPTVAKLFSKFVVGGKMKL